LIRLAGQRMTNDGVLVIDAQQYRSQERNREMRNPGWSI
jgi:protein subunit release factor B